MALHNPIRQPACQRRHTWYVLTAGCNHYGAGLNLAFTCVEEPPTVKPVQPDDVDAREHRRSRSQLFETLNHFLSGQVRIRVLVTQHGVHERGVVEVKRIPALGPPGFTWPSPLQNNMFDAECR
jgi:hypothetical protein